jgi:hypothetical protein
MYPWKGWSPAMVRRIHRHNRIGFTLLEVLVASGISLLLGIVIVRIFGATRTSLDHASGRISLVQKARLPVERLSRYVTAAVGTPSEASIIYPPLLIKADGSKTNDRGMVIKNGEVQTWDRVLLFRTTEDFFATTATVGYEFDPEGIMNINDIKNNLDIWERDDQRLTEYVIWFEDDTNINWLPQASNCIAIARLNDTVLSAQRTSDWARAWLSGANPESQFQAGIEPRIIAHGIKDAGFRVREAGGVQVSVEVEGEIRQASQTVLKSFRFDGFLQVPSERFNNV